MADPILKIKNLNVEYPLFGGILQKEVNKYASDATFFSADGEDERESTQR